MRKTSTLLALGLALAGCGSKKPIAQAPQAVQTKRISSDPTAASGAQRFSAVVEPDARVPVSFRIPGYVIAIKQTRGEGGGMRDLAEGDRVSAGTVLVRIRSAEYEDKVHQAASQAAAAEAVALKAKLDFERATRLFASQSLTKPDFDGAQAQYDATQSQLKAARALTSEAEIALRDTSVVAPFDGEIVEKAVELGAFVGPGAPVFAVARTDVVKIVIGVPDTALPSVTLGQPVDVDRRRLRRPHVPGADQPHRVGGRSPDAELRGRGRDPEPRSCPEGRDDRLAPARGPQGCDGAGLGPGSAVGDRAGRRRQATASTSSPVRRARRRRSCARSRSAR